MTRTWDVAVVGAGVAGSALGISLLGLRPEARVVMIDRREPGGRRVGETLPPHATRLLERLGIKAGFDALDPLPAHGTSAAWDQAGLHHNPFLFTGQGHGWHVDRGAFDAWLSREARGRGAQLRTPCEVGRIARDEQGVWAVEVDGSVLRARTLVDATGRKAALAGRLDARRRTADRLVCAWRSFARAAPLRDSRTLIEARPYGWWYSAGLPCGGLIVALMTDSDIARSHGLREVAAWEAMLGETDHTLERVAHAAPDSELRLQAACTQWLEPVGGPGWIAVGDAAFALDPLSSLGMLEALRTGILGSYAILDQLDGKAGASHKYAALVGAEVRGYRVRRARVYGEVTRFGAHPFWARRQGAAAA